MLLSRPTRRTIVYIWILLASTFLSAQTANSLDPAKIPDSVVLSGTVDWIVGSLHDAGGVTLTARADGSTEESWSLTQKSRTVKQSGFDGERICEITDETGKTSIITQASCYRPVPWFAPWVAVKTEANSLVSKLDKVREHSAEYGLKTELYTLKYPDSAFAKPKVAERLQKLVTDNSVEITYEGQPQLATRLRYRDYPDSDHSRSIETEVVFSDYRNENGFLIPHHIQRYVQRTLQLDFVVSSVTVH